MGPDGDRVYGLGRDGTLLCLRAADGKLVWTKNIMEDFKVPRLYYGWATSPVVAGDFLLINANSAGIALFYGPACLSAVEAETGNILWAFPHYDHMHPIADPVVFANKVFFSTFMQGTLLELAGNTAAQRWSNDWFVTKLETPVLVNGYLYGTHHYQSVGDMDWAGLLRLVQPYACIDATTGELMWKKDMGITSATAADVKLIVLEGNGTLRILEATPLEYRELSSADLYAGADKPAGRNHGFRLTVVLNITISVGKYVRIV